MNYISLITAVLLAKTVLEESISSHFAVNTLVVDLASSSLDQKNVIMW